MLSELLMLTGVDSALMGVIVGGWTTVADEKSGVADLDTELIAS